MSIDWDKPIETVSGTPAKVISTDFRSTVGASVFLQIEYENWSGIGHYMRKGEPEYGSPKIRNCKTKREGWVNVYRGGMVSDAYKTESRAKDAAYPGGDGVVLVATIKIEWEE